MSVDDLVNDSSEELRQFLSSEYDPSVFEAPKSGVRVHLNTLKSKFKARYTGLKESLFPKIAMRSLLLELPPELRQMIWHDVASDGSFVLHVHTAEKQADLEARRKLVASTPREQRDRVEFKTLPQLLTCIRKGPDSCKKALLLVCKQIKREVTDTYFRNRTIEVRRSIDWAGRFHPSTFRTLKAPRTIDIMSNVRHLSTFLRVNPMESWHHSIQGNAWFFRLVRLCPQIRTVQITVQWWPWKPGTNSTIDPHKDAVRVLIPGQVQLVLSKAQELMPIAPDSVDGPRIARASSTDRNPSCPVDGATCICTWTVAFHFVPGRTPRVGPGADFHNPAVDDWSNQVLFSHARRRKQDAYRNRLERQIGVGMTPPATLLPLCHERPPATDEFIDWDDYWQHPISRPRLAYWRLRYAIAMAFDELLFRLGL